MTPERGRRTPVGGLGALIASAFVVCVLVAVAMVSSGTATATRAALFPHPTPTATVPAWLTAPSSAPTIGGATPLSDSAPVPAASALARELNQRLTPGSGSIAAAVLDGATGQTLYSKSGDEPQVPASNLKLLTAAAVLTTLGPDATLRTRVVRGADPGTVVLVGSGDVMLGAGASQPGAVMGRAGMATLASETAAALAGTHDAAGSPGASPSPAADHGTVTVRLDDTLFTGPSLNPAWAPEDVEAGEIAPLYALALNAGRSAPGAAGARPRDSAMEAATAFRAELARALAASGMKVAAGVERAAAPANAAELASVESATIAEQTGYVLRESDNYGAEALGRLASHAAGGAASNDGAVSALKATAGRILGSSDGLVLVDACGLAIADRVTPAALAGVVRAMTSGADSRLRAALDGLPVAALDGTLARRFGGTASAGAGVVRAKTGTLNTVAALSGYLVDVDGRLLVFSLVANGVDPAARQRAIAAIDSGVAALAGCGCRS
ncbi:D-alanyl-D-alanine carboxypeptidase/D-alanyl-D-alanine-endopeptidase [Sinomonas notoginsengisoli]|uniref:D-alanyl-D-alanine carboxypeptidase/D-alanyl-D-alanine-endopeptidase n=1 Tax=Sinomonas notoginsengisoli TaxID=1457311 RepID=UPI001F33CC03|nr:D-alanyl-D-alanine carboxypeptidase [Sinomonas notoginsengisoli]